MGKLGENPSIDDDDNIVQDSLTFDTLHALRRLMQGGPDHPKAPLGNNFRPPQPLLHRPVRTNIDFRSKQNGKACPSMYRDVHYKVSATVKG
uniref:Uncharacterized protein n=1 Tax=Phlebotomus papatasi TaxID=29031 RepID=A0A1B0D4Q2_PHLPP